MLGYILILRILAKHIYPIFTTLQFMFNTTQFFFYLIRLLYQYFPAINEVSYRDVRQGYAKPSEFGAKASLKNDVIGVFAPLSSLTYGRGVVCYKTGVTRKPRNH